MVVQACLAIARMLPLVLADDAAHRPAEIVSAIFCRFDIFVLHALKCGLLTAWRQGADLATFPCSRPQAPESISSIGESFKVDYYSVAIAWRIEAQW